MKAELTISPEFADELAKMILERIKPILSDKASPQKTEDVLFDVKGLCEYLVVGSDWIYKHVHLKEIPHLKVKGLLRFKKKDIDKWLNSFNVPLTGQSKKIMKVIKNS